MTQKYRTRVVTVDAVQWNGENIADVQALLTPASPLWSPVSGSPAIGIYCDKPAKTQYDTPRELVHADVDDWIVKYPSGRIAIIKAAYFKEYFAPEPVVPESFVARDLPTGTYAPGATFPLEAPIVGTHPRLAESSATDRQPELDGGAVSER